MATATVNNKIKEIEQKVSDNNGVATRFKWTVRNAVVDEIIDQGLHIVIGLNVGYYLFNAGRLYKPMNALYIVTDGKAIAPCSVQYGDISGPTPYVFVRPMSPHGLSALRLVYHVMTTPQE